MRRSAWILSLLLFGSSTATCAEVPPAALLATPPAWCSEPRAREFADIERLPLDDAWFEVYRVRPDTYLFYEPYQSEQASSYLIVGTERALLFDSGLGLGDLGALIRRITQLPVVVLNSHTHFDHVGSNADFEQVWNLDNPYSRGNARGVMEPVLGAYAAETLKPGRLCKVPPGSSASQRDYKLRPWKVTHRVKDGETIKLGGRELTVMATPGHSPDALCLYEQKQGLLFTGDTFYRGPIYVWMPGADVTAYSRSIDRLSQLTPRPKLLLPGHGAPTATPHDLQDVAAALEKIRAGKARGEEVDGNREYRFGAFSLVLPR